MIVTGTITNPDGSQFHLDAEGATYEETLENLNALLEEGQKLLVIRTDHY